MYSIYINVYYLMIQHVCKIQCIYIYMYVYIYIYVYIYMYVVVPILYSVVVGIFFIVRGWSLWLLTLNTGWGPQVYGRYNDN